MKTTITLFALFFSTIVWAQDTVKTESGLKIITLQKGDGPTAKIGQEVKVKYLGFLMNEEVFDESPGFKYTLGDKTIIPGWNEALQLMNAGQKAIIVLPPHLAYGEKGAKDEFEPDKYSIPPNATINFEITLLKIK